MRLRGRGITPEYWSDRRLARLSADVRELYIGLWMVADDEGWIAWDLEQIASLLYSYRSVAVRERQIRKWAGTLVDEGRVVVADCGSHARIPTLPGHQKAMGGNKGSQVAREHRTQCMGRPQTDEDVRVRVHGTTRHSTTQPAAGAYAPTRNHQSRDGLWHTGQHDDCRTCNRARETIQ